MLAISASAGAQEARGGPGEFPSAPHAEPSWAGFYVGIEGGANFLSNQTYGFGGLRAGYDLEFDRFIAGMELSADYRPARTGNLFNWTGSSSGTVYQTAISTEADYIGMATVHIGYEVTRRFLPYVSGGLALSPLSLSTTVVGLSGPRAGAFGTASSSTLRTGWTVGAGVRAALTDHWSLEPQYRYYSFPKVTLVDTAYLGGVPVAYYTLSDTGRGSLLGLAANYRF